MQALGVVADEVHGVMVDPAAHEDKVIADPVGNAKAEHILIERRGLLDVVHARGDVADFQRIDAAFGFVLRVEAAVGIDLDLRTLGIGEDDGVGNARGEIGAPFAHNAGRGELAGHVGKIAARHDLEGDAREIGVVALFQHQRIPGRAGSPEWRAAHRARAMRGP